MANRNLTAAARERVAATIAAGDTIGAINLYRADTFCSPAEARAAVAAMAAAQAAGPAAVAAALSPVTDDGVADAIFAGRKIEAIKRYRQAHRAELRQAKEVVEALEAQLRVSDPARFEQAHPAGDGSCLGRAVVVLLAAAALAAGVWHWLHR